MDVENTIREIFGKRADLSNATRETKLNELDIDSLDLVEAMMDVETEFNIEFANEEIINLKTVDDVIKLVEAKTK